MDMLLWLELNRIVLKNMRFFFLVSCVLMLVVWMFDMSVDVFVVGIIFEKGENATMRF